MYVGGDLVEGNVGNLSFGDCKKMANVIINDDTGKEFNYCQLSKHPKHQKI